MTDFLPLFPLKLVAFPGETLNLHIFEPRYRQLIRECHHNKTTFGIPPHIEGKVMTVGTELRLTELVKTYEDGKMDIRCHGIGRFKMTQMYKEAPGKLYAGADIERLPAEENGDLVLAQRIIEQLKDLFELLNVKKRLPENPSNLFTYDWAHFVGFSLEQEYSFLCINDEMDRQMKMKEHLEVLIPSVIQMNKLRDRVKMNGHFRNEIPPEI